MPNGGVRIRRVVELVVAAAIGAILQNMAMSFLSAPRHFVGGDGLLPYRSNREPPYIPCKYQSALLFLAGSACFSHIDAQNVQTPAGRRRPRRRGANSRTSSSLLDMQSIRSVGPLH